MVSALVPIAGILVLYCMYKTYTLQRTMDLIRTSAPSNSTNIPHEVQDVADNYMDPSMVHRLVAGAVKSYDEPGNYGVIQRNLVHLNDDIMPTFGPNYSKSFT